MILRCNKNAAQLIYRVLRPKFETVMSAVENVLTRMQQVIKYKVKQPKLIETKKADLSNI